MNKFSLASTSILLSFSLLAGCSANGITTKSTDNIHTKNNGFIRPLDTTAPAAIPFPDVPSTEWYADNVQWGSYLGIINGYPDGTFRPNSPISRAEVIKIIKSLADYGYLNIHAAPTPTPSPTITPTPTNPVTSTTTTPASPTPT